jgi:hypothetical protein
VKLVEGEKVGAVTKERKERAQTKFFPCKWYGKVGNNSVVVWQSVESEKLRNLFPITYM